MFTKSLATALVTGLLLTGAMSNQSFAGMGGGGGDGNFDWAESHRANGTKVTSRANRDGSRTVTTRRAGKLLQKRVVHRNNRPWASAHDPKTGTRTTAIGNGDGTRTVITISPFGLSIGFSR